MGVMIIIVVCIICCSSSLSDDESKIDIIQDIDVLTKTLRVKVKFYTKVQKLLLYNNGTLLVLFE